MQYQLIRLVDTVDKTLITMGYVPNYTQDFFDFGTELMTKYSDRSPVLYSVYTYEYITGFSTNPVMSYSLFVNYFVRYWEMFTYDILIIPSLPLDTIEDY